MAAESSELQLPPRPARLLGSHRQCLDWASSRSRSRSRQRRRQRGRIGFTHLTARSALPAGLSVQLHWSCAGPWRRHGAAHPKGLGRQSRGAPRGAGCTRAWYPLGAPLAIVLGLALSPLVCWCRYQMAVCLAASGCRTRANLGADDWCWVQHTLAPFVAPRCAEQPSMPASPPFPPARCATPPAT